MGRVAILCTSHTPHSSTKSEGALTQVPYHMLTIRLPSGARTCVFDLLLSTCSSFVFPVCFQRKGLRGRKLDDQMESPRQNQDEDRLAQLGYKQELKRDWSLLHNFGVSFAIIVSS